MTDQPRICDYEGSDYRTRFWENAERNYEDIVERRVIRQLLPQKGRRLLELGAGFGRLSQEYSAYDTVVLLDYSFSQLQYAREQLGDDGFVYVAADAYKLPFKSAVFDGATMIRVLHHFENVPLVFEGIQRVIAQEGMFLLEFANKHNMKAILRHAMGRQEWNPSTLTPVEFVELNYNFHPDYIADALDTAGFTAQTRIPVSFLRLGILKQTIPANILASADAMLQKTGMMIAPSIFTRNITINDAEPQLNVNDHDIFACPLTQGELTRDGDTMVNAEGTRWEIRDGIYDFKQPIE